MSNVVIPFENANRICEYEQNLKEQLKVTADIKTSLSRLDSLPTSDKYLTLSNAELQKDMNAELQLLEGLKGKLINLIDQGGKLL